MSFDAHKNLAVSTVATAPSTPTAGTSLIVAAGQGSRFPTPPFNATIWPASSAPDPSNAEIVRVTAISTDTLTITRAQEGTTARSVGVGDQIVASITAKTITDVEALVFARAQAMPLFIYGCSYAVSTGQQCTAGLEYHNQAKAKYLLQAATAYGVGGSRIFESACWAINGGAAPDSTAAPAGSSMATPKKGLVVVDTSINDIAHCATAISSSPVAISGSSYTTGVQKAHEVLFALAATASRIEQTSGTLTGTWSTNTNTLYSGGSNSSTTTPGDKLTISATPPQTGPFAGKVYLLTYCLDPSIAANAQITVKVDGTLQSTYVPVAWEMYTGLAGGANKINYIPAVIAVTLPTDAASHSIEFAHAGSSGQDMFVDAILVPGTSQPQVFVMQSPTPVANGGGFTSGGVTTWQANQSAVETAVKAAIGNFPNAHWVPTTMTTGGLYSGDGIHPNDRGMKQRSEDLLGVITSYLAGIASGSEPDALYTKI